MKDIVLKKIKELNNKIYPPLLFKKITININNNIYYLIVVL